MTSANNEKNRKLKDLSKNTMLFTIGSFGARIISFLLVPLYTYVLSTVEYGSIDIVTTTVQLLIPVLTLNVQDAVLRFALDRNYRQEDVIRISLGINAFSTVLLGIVLGVLGSIQSFSQERNYWLFLYVSFILGALNNTLIMYLKAKGKVVVITLWGIINTFLTCGLNLVLLLVFGFGVNGYMISCVSATMTSVIGMFIMADVLGDIRKSKPNHKLRKEMLIYSIPLVTNSIAWWVNNASDRYILTYICGAAVNGIYSVSYKIPSILSVMQTVFYNAWSVSAINEYDKNDTDGFIGNVYSAYSTLSIVACSLIMLFNKKIALILYAKEFYVAWKYVPLLLVGTVYSGLGLFLGCIFSARKLTKEISLTTVLGALINTILNVALIPYVGAFGAAFATMIGYFSVWVIRSICVRKIVVMRVNWVKQISSLVVLMIQCMIATCTNSVLLQIPCLIVQTFLLGDMLAKVCSKLMQFLRKR